MFSHAPKKSVYRVNVSDHTKAKSPLLQEVRPEDISDTRPKEWAEMDEEDYDDNYIASTDPIHPVTTDYSHPLDDDDGSWMLNHFSPDELDSSAEAVAVDFEKEHNWSWGDDSNDEWKEENSDDDTGQWDTTTKPEEGLMAWGPEAEVTSASVELDMHGLLRNEEAIQKEHVQEVVKAFWAVVNGTDDNNDRQSRHPTNELNGLLHNLDLSASTCALRTTSPPTPPTTPTKISHQWMDGASALPIRHQSHQLHLHSHLPRLPPVPQPLLLPTLRGQSTTSNASISKLAKTKI
jgi:hypothetical protein